MKIFREKAGVISKNPVWVCFHKEYMYFDDTLFGLFVEMIIHWNHESKYVM